MHRPEQSDRLLSLAGLARAVAGSASLNDVLEIAAEETRAALDAASVSVSRLEQGGRVVRTLVNVGDLGPTEVRWPADEVYPVDDFANLRRVAGEHVVWRVRHDDPDADPRELELLRELGKGAAVGAPLLVDGQLWGEFYATRPLGAPGYEADDVCYLEALTAIVGGAVSRAQREAALNELAYHDPLTGLLNRRALDERAAAWFTVTPGLERPVTAVMADVNGLKQVNDDQGHLAGDQLLQAVAGALLRQFADFPGALVARIGGDEFAVLVPGHPARSVLAAADALCTMTWALRGTANLSCGAATAVVTGERTVDPAALFAAADRAQYVAKRGRLRRTVVDDEFGVECESMGA